MKRIFSVLLVLSLISFTAYAEDTKLGNLVDGGVSLIVAEGTVYEDNTYYSSQSGVGFQHERYYTYAPNENIVPILWSGDYVYGRKTLTEATDAVRKKGLIPLMGINAGFFSLQTGVPMSNVIEDGIIIAKETEGADAVGFYEDGSCVIDWLSINTVLKSGDKTINIANINKYRQPFGAYLLNDRFYSDTRVSDAGLDIIIGSVSGDFRLGETVTGIVEEKTKTDKATAIPKGKMVITIADESITHGYRELYESLEGLEVGDKISITNTVANPNVWNDAVCALGSVGGRVIKDGKITDADAAAAPRTAVGVKEDGSVVFYTIDGRQQSSYGIRLKTLGERLLELGCTDAVNFDGGGSTTLNGIMPGDWHSTLLNSPSDGSVRSCTNFFMLLNKSKQTSTLSQLYMYPYSGTYLSGEKESFTVKGVDHGHYPAKIDGEVSFSVDMEGCSIDKSGNAVFNGNGDCTVTASFGDLTKSVTVKVKDSPDELVFQNENGWKNIYSLTVSRGEKVELSAVPFINHIEHFVKDTDLLWEITEGLAFIDGDGTFIAPNKAGSGKIRVSMGNCSKELSFTVTDKTPWQNGGNFTEGEMSFENGVLTCTFTNPAGIPMSWATLYVDGKKYPSQLKDNRLTAKIEDGRLHKVKVLGDNQLETKTLCYNTVNKGKYISAFPDTEGHWADEYVSHLTNLAITDYSYMLEQSVYNPDVSMTRLDFAIMTAKVLGLDIDKYESYTPEILDADSIPQQCMPYVKALVAEKIISGKGTEEGAYFAPFDNITRAEVAAIIGRTMPYGVRSGKITATDEKDIPSWAVSGFNVLSRYNIISGYPDGSVKPGNNITRAECARILFEIL